MSRDITMTGLSAYFVEIKPKEDFKGSISDKFEFFSSMNVSKGSDNLIRLCFVGVELSDIVAEVERVIRSYAYISRVDILPNDIIVCDYYKSKCD